MIKVIQGMKAVKDTRDLKDHISKLVKSENFGVLLGAGASNSVGGQLMRDMWENFAANCANSYQWLKDENFLEYSKQKTGSDKGESHLVEMLVDLLSIAIEDRKRLDDGKLNKALEIRSDLMRSIVKAAKLEQELWNPSPIVRKDSKHLHLHKRFLRNINFSRRGLQSAPFIFTTNYDIAIEVAAEATNMTINNGFQRFLDDLEFTPQSFYQDGLDTRMGNHRTRSSNKIIYIKLHGSILWEEFNNKVRQVKLSDAYDNISGFIRGNPNMPKLLVMPGSTKYIKTTEFLFTELLRQFSNFLARENPVLFLVGYSFGDEHINQQIISALIHRKNLRLVIYCPEFNDVNNMSGLAEDLQTIINLGDPNVTVVGGGEQAYFDEFVEHLPIE